MTATGIQASIHAVLGSSGCGKTTHVRTRVTKKKRRRTMVWSPKEVKDRYADWWPGSVVCTTTTEVLAIVKAAGKRGEFHIVFRPTLNRKQDEKQFDVFCKIALAAEDLLFIVDELHTVTRPGWACDGWRKLVMMGREYKTEIWGLSQRPASMDKDFLGNVSTIHGRRQSHADDYVPVAKALGVKLDEMSGMSGFMWIERDNLTGKITKG